MSGPPVHRPLPVPGRGVAENTQNLGGLTAEWAGSGSGKAGGRLTAA